MEVIQSVLIIQQVTFPNVLGALLEERDSTKSQLYDYLIGQDYWIEKTSMYRYFNNHVGVSRIPDRRFIKLFANFIGLQSVQEDALLDLRDLKRRRTRRP